MDAIITRASSIHGTLSLPADKAICHRAALLCALAKGVTEITPWSPAEDCQKTLAILQELGVPVSRTPSGIRIEGVGLTGLKPPNNPLDCGDSGTTMRLACGVLAGQPFTSRLTAGPSLSRRPMRRIVEPLRRMGANIQAISMASFEGHPPEDYPPLDITGTRPLRGIAYALPVASAQVKSAIFLAGLYAKSPTTVIEPTATRNHTEQLLSRLGATIRRQEGAITLEPSRGEMAAPGELTIPADPSSAAFFIVGALVLPGSRFLIRDVGLNPMRIAFVKVLQRMGAAIRVEAEGDGWEPRGTITVESAPLSGTTVSANDVPSLIDELPVLMVAACAARGETRFHGLGELRVKETDRLDSMVTGLKAMDANLLVSPDGSLVVQGGHPLRGAAVESFGDHRTAMSLAIAGLLAEGETRIRHAECVAKSFPDFFECLASVTGGSSVKTIDNS